MIRRLSGWMAALAAVATMAAADAQAQAKVGHLRCDVAGGVSFIFGSTRGLDCVYTPVGSDRVEQYSGEIKTFGIDIGYRESGVMLWAVFAPAADPGPGALAGTYAGGSAGAAVGVGLGADALFGGSEKSIGLQPVSITGYEGVNVAAGISALDLQAK